MLDESRRTFLKTVGASATAATVPIGVATAEEGWRTAETPVETTLWDVEYTAGNPFAVGGGGVLLERRSSGWTTVLRGGPTGNGNGLYGAATTDDGRRLWVVGASGAIGEYDVETGNLVDRSAPNDVTNNFNDVAVTGSAGAADVYVADDSGSIHYSFDNGETGTWEYEVPGSGSGFPAIEFYDSRSGHAIDTNGKVFATDDGVTYEAIGLEDADVTFYGLDSDAENDVTVSGGNASVFTYDGSGWTTESLGDADLKDIETGGSGGHAVGSGGVVFERSGGTWAGTDTPTGENLNAVATGSVDLVVGSGGTVIEK
jgi:hypothetical protein